MSAAVQLALFPAAERNGAAQPARGYPRQPGFKAAGASQEAAAKIARSADRLRDAVLEELRREPSTADEVAARLGRSFLAVRPRLSQLRAIGQIIPTGERRPNKSGMSATVWTVAASTSTSW